MSQKLLSILCLKRLSVFLSLFLLSLLNLSVFPSLRITLPYWGTRQGTALIKHPFSMFQLGHDTPALPPCPKISQHSVFVSRQGCVLEDAHWGKWDVYYWCFEKWPPGLMDCFVNYQMVCDLMCAEFEWTCWNTGSFMNACWFNYKCLFLREEKTC